MNKGLLFKNIWAGVAVSLVLYVIGFIFTDWRYWVILFVSLLIANLFFMRTASPDKDIVNADPVEYRGTTTYSPVKLNKNQYKILMSMPNLHVVYKYSDLFAVTRMDLKTLKKEMKALREMGLVTYVSTFNSKTGHMTGTGHVVTADRIDETLSLVHQYERNHRIFIS